MTTDPRSPVAPVSDVSSDAETQAYLAQIASQERIRANKVAGVRTVLVVLSAAGMVFDIEALRQKILLTYPDAAIFFQTTDGKAIGATVPQQVDLLIDFTGPGQRQGLFHARKLRGMARIAVGRNAGLFRKKIYDRVFDEKAQKASNPDQPLKGERVIQRAVLELAGIALVQAGDSLPDRGKTIALELPPFARL